MAQLKNDHAKRENHLRVRPVQKISKIISKSTTEVSQVNQGLRINVKFDLI